MSREPRGIDVMLDRVFDFELRVPHELRSPYRGAVFILGMGLGLRGKILFAAMLLALVLLLGPLKGPLLLGLLLGVAVLAGGLGGALYGLLWPLSRAGDFGVWLRWAAAIFIYLAAFVYLLPHSPFALNDPAFRTLAVALAALGGLGMVLTDDRGAGRLSPGQFRRLQNRMLLQAAPARTWKAMKRKRRRYDVRRQALIERAVRRPEALYALVRMLTDLRAELGQFRRGLARHLEAHPADQADLDAWTLEVEQQLDSLPPLPPRRPR